MRALLWPSAIALSSLAVGCSSGGSAPAIPAPPSGAPAAASLAIPSSDVAGAETAELLSSIWEVELQLGDSPTANLVPLRAAAAAGDNYAVDATGFLASSPCDECLEISGMRLSPTGDAVEVDFSMKHPFLLPDLPYVLASRLDLHGLDMMGYLLTPGDGAPLTFGSSRVAGLYLRNADGYSNLLDAALEPIYSTPDITEHPYRIFFRDDTAGNFDGSNPNGWANPRAPQGHNVMPMGADWGTVTYDIALDPGAPSTRFGFAVGTSWGKSATGPGSNLGQRQNPIAYVNEFHHKAAWTVKAAVVSNNLEGGNAASTAQLLIALRDWQLGATVDPSFAFGVTPPDQISASSDIASLSLEIPGLLTAPITIDPTSGIGSGSLEDKIFAVAFTNALGAPEGTYFAWIKAVDSRAPRPDAIIDRSLTPGTLTDFHTGTLVRLDVINAPPTAAVAGPIVFECLGGTYTLDASGSTDFGTLSYEFDFDVPAGDPLNFVADVGPQPGPTTNHTFISLPTHVGVRVTDPGLLSDIALMPITNQIVTPGPVITYSPFVNPVVQYFGYEYSSAAPLVSTAGNYVFVTAEAHSGSGPAAGANSQFRFWRTSDGATWQPLASLPNTNAWGSAWAEFSLAAAEDGTVYLLNTIPSGGNFSFDWNTRICSIDNWGTGTWTTRHSYQPATNQHSRQFIWVHPTNPNLIIGMIARNGNNPVFLRSTTGAAGPWSNVTPFGGNVDLFALHPKPNGDLLATFSNTFQDRIEARLSTDQGATWPSIGTPYSFNPIISYIGGAGAQDPTDPTGNTVVVIYKGHQSAGVSGDAGIHAIRTIDGGLTWTPGDNMIETMSPYLAGDPAIIRAAFDGGGGLYVSYFKALWGADNRGFVAFSPDRGTSFQPDYQIYDTNPQPSWPGFQITRMPDDCEMIAVFSEFQNLRSRTF